MKREQCFFAAMAIWNICICSVTEESISKVVTPIIAAVFTYAFCRGIDQTCQKHNEQ